jgi:magnesium chelatase family protein
VFPTRFLLVAATNPCPCGFGPGDRCRCSEAELMRHRRRLSGPLLDRLDLLIGVERVASADLGAAPAMTSAQARERVLEARDRQARRLAGTGASCNGHMSTAVARNTARLTPGAQRALLGAYERTGLSTRGHQRLIRVARTVADLAGSDRVHREHMTEALGMRQEEPGKEATG